MAIEITEQMQVDAPIAKAWAFITDPQRVAGCMPGAKIVEQKDEKTYVGQAKVKLGAITTSYKGEVTFVDVNELAHRMKITGEGREKGGGTARGALEVSCEAVGETATQLTFEVTVDLTGKVMQMGRGMIKGVSTQLFKQFAANARSQLETDASGETPSGEAFPAQESLAVGSLVGKTLWQMVINFFRRLFGRGRDS